MHAEDNHASIPKVSVMIPCYNSGAILRDTLESLVHQTFTDWEAVCVNDISTDGTRKLLEEYASKFSGKFRIVDNALVDGKKKRHPYNLGWMNTTGEWVVDLSHDDVLSSDFLEAAMGRLYETGADAIVATVGRFVTRPEDGKLVLSGLDGDLDAVISGREAVMLSLDWQITGFCCWRGDIARSTLINEEEVPYDWGELESRKRFSLCRTVAFSKGIYWHRFNPTSVTRIPWGRRSHMRLVTNREVLSLLVAGHYPKQIIDFYRIATYRLFCVSCVKFRVSDFYKKHSESRRVVHEELRAYYQDERILDRPSLAGLCPSWLDQFRLRHYWSVIPITIWRKFMNRLLRRPSIF